MPDDVRLVGCDGGREIGIARYHEAVQFHAAAIQTAETVLERYPDSDACGLALRTIARIVPVALPVTVIPYSAGAVPISVRRATVVAKPSAVSLAQIRAILAHVPRA